MAGGATFLSGLSGATLFLSLKTSFCLWGRSAATVRQKLTKFSISGHPWKTAHERAGLVPIWTPARTSQDKEGWEGQKWRWKLWDIGM